MVLVKKSKDIKQKVVSKKRLISTTFLGVGVLIIPITLFYVNPVLLIVQRELRLENGSMLNELLLSRLTSTKIYIYLFNITNAERFISGADEKVKLEEIGPFVYQEYRINADLEINKDPGIMRYTPKLETVFVPEDSIGDPKDINVTVPNIAMLAGTAMISKYPYLVRQIYNIVIASNKLKPFIELRAYDYIWGYSNPLIQLANNVVPGLIYFKSVGLLERLYDVGVDYRLEIGTTNEDKFSVKKVTKIQALNQSTGATTLLDSTFLYKEAYEGAAYPPGLTPDTPVNIYRHGVCKTFRLQYVAARQMSYGGVGFVYYLHNDTFRDRQQCDAKGWCPEGLLDLSDCYFGFPVALSKGHFLDSDPRLLDMVEGLTPDRNSHDTQIIIEPTIGVGISCSMALQMNLVLGDVAFNPETRRLKDIVLPISYIIAKSPPLIEEVNSVLHFMYTSGAYGIGIIQVICTLLGLYLLTHSGRMMYWTWLAREETKRKHFKAQWPLLI